MRTQEMIDALLELSENMTDDEREILERASAIILEHQVVKGTYCTESRVTAIGHTYYAAIGEAVKALDLAPRDRIKITVERL